MTKRTRPRPGNYHRHVLGGGSVVKAVTRTRRAAASHELGGSFLYRKAMDRILRLAERYDA